MNDTKAESREPKAELTRPTAGVVFDFRLSAFPNAYFIHLNMSLKDCLKLPVEAWFFSTMWTLLAGFGYETPGS